MMESIESCANSNSKPVTQSGNNNEDGNPEMISNISDTVTTDSADGKEEGGVDDGSSISTMTSGSASNVNAGGAGGASNSTDTISSKAADEMKIQTTLPEMNEYEYPPSDIDINDINACDPHHLLVPLVDINDGIDIMDMELDNDATQERTTRPAPTSAPTAHPIVIHPPIPYIPPISSPSKSYYTQKSSLSIPIVLDDSDEDEIMDILAAANPNPIPIHHRHPVIACVDDNNHPDPIMTSTSAIVTGPSTSTSTGTPNDGITPTSTSASATNMTKERVLAMAKNRVKNASLSPTRTRTRNTQKQQHERHSTAAITAATTSTSMGTSTGTSTTTNADYNAHMTNSYFNSDTHNHQHSYHESKNDTAATTTNNDNNNSNISSALYQSQLQECKYKIRQQQELVQQQTQELKQYTAMLDNYRDTVRTKNKVIVSLENDVNLLKLQSNNATSATSATSNPNHGTDHDRHDRHHTTYTYPTKSHSKIDDTTITQDAEKLHASFSSNWLKNTNNTMDHPTLSYSAQHKDPSPQPQHQLPLPTLQVPSVQTPTRKHQVHQVLQHPSIHIHHHMNSPSHDSAANTTISSKSPIRHAHNNNISYSHLRQLSTSSSNTNTHSTASTSSNLKEEDEPNEANPIIQSKYIAEISAQSQIISSLTNENNAFRTKEVQTMSRISKLQKEVERYQSIIQSRIVLPEAELVQCKEDLEKERKRNEFLEYQVRNYQEVESEGQVQIAGLGQDVIRLEKEVEQVSCEKEGLQCLLDMAREATSEALQRCKEQEEKWKDATTCNRLQYLDREGEKEEMNTAVTVSDMTTTTEMNSQDITLPPPEGQDEDVILDGTIASATVASTSTASSSSQQQQQPPPLPLPQSNATLKEELEAAMERESDLRLQLSQALNQNVDSTANSTSTTPSSTTIIMEKLSESQQEAINYLSREVDELRTQVSSEQSKSKTNQAQQTKLTNKIQILQQENVSISKQVVTTHTTLERLQNDLSAKVGENVCLKDEICDMEGVVRSKEEQVHELNRQMEEWKEKYNESCNANVQSKVHDNDYDEMEEGDDMGVSSRTILARQVGVNSSIMVPDETLEGMDSDAKENVDAQLHGGGGGSLRKLSVLKKAMKQKYKSNLEEFQKSLKDKDEIIQDLHKKYQQEQKRAMEKEEEVHSFEARRISYEAQIQQEQEDLTKSLEEERLKVFSLQKRMKQYEESAVELPQLEESWKTVSDTVSAGVSKSVEMFHALSLNIIPEDIDDERARKANGNRNRQGSPIPVLRSTNTFS